MVKKLNAIKIYEIAESGNIGTYCLVAISTAEEQATSGMTSVAQPGSRHKS